MKAVQTTTKAQSDQLEAVINDVMAVFNSWGADTPIEKIRQDWDNLFSNVKPVVGAVAEEVNAGSVRAEWIRAPRSREDRTVIFLHGGGFVLGSINSHRDICERISQAAGVRVLALEYALAPENPFPAQLEDSLAAYEWLLKQGVSPEYVALCGDSAGGGLALSTMLALKDAGRPLPVCAALMSPFVDMEMIGNSMVANDELDPMVHKPMVEVMVSSFLQGGDARHPLANPLYGDFSGLPPLLIHAGERETLLDDSLRVADRARKANVGTELKVWPGQIHVFHIFAARLEEGDRAIREIGEFLRKYLK